jgi:glutathione-regulated potassium-efflux system ancillary protein KefG
MTPMINTDDLLDAQGVADLIGLRHANSVHTYLRRYPAMPRPVLDLGPGRPRLWLRPQVERWLIDRSGGDGAQS